MNEPFKQHGAFSWCELMTPDVDAAKAFIPGCSLGYRRDDDAGVTYTVVKGRQRHRRHHGDTAGSQGHAPAWAST